MSNWRRREAEVKPYRAPGSFAVTAAFSDLTVVGVGDHDGITSSTVAIARTIAWSRHAPLAHAREWREQDRTRVDLFAAVPSPDAVRRAWLAFTGNQAVGEAIMFKTPAGMSEAFTGSTDRVPEGRPIPGGGVAEIYVRFTNWQIYYQPCKTGMVATARIAAWLTRYPLARVRETNGQVLIVLIDIDEACPDDLKTTQRV